MDEKILLLQKVDLFSKLSIEELETISRYCDFVSFDKGVGIFREGTSCEELFVIQKGSIVIRKELHDKRSEDIARFVEGECFGEMDLFENCPRSVTAIAESDVTLMRFPRKGVSFREIVDTHPVISAQMLHKLIAIIAGRIRSVNKLISEKTPWAQDLRRKLLTDKLTGVYNKTFLDDEFPRHMHEYGETFSLLVIKPDNFKEINDTFGHDAGDRVLTLLAIYIHFALQAHDIVVRYKGDEFIAILPHASFDTAVNRAEEIRSTIAGMNVEFVTRGPFSVLTSIGVSTFPHHAADERALIESAVKKMYEMRNKGGNGVNG